MKAKFFSLKRFKKTAYYQLYTNIKSALIFFGGLMGIFIFGALMGLLVGRGLSIDFFQSWFSTGYIVTAMAIAGSSFRELRNSKLATQYLTIPASSFEKFISAWLYSIIIGIVGYFLMMIIFNVLMIAIGKIVNQQVIFYNFLSIKNTWYLTIAYLVINSIFLLGASIFKRSVIFQTIMWAFIILFASEIIQVLIAKYIIFAEWRGFFDYIQTLQESQISDLKNTIEIIGKVSIILFTLLLWTATYFKIKEKEIV